MTPPHWSGHVTAPGSSSVARRSATPPHRAGQRDRGDAPGVVWATGARRCQPDRCLVCGDRPMVGMGDGRPPMLVFDQRRWRAPHGREGVARMSTTTTTTDPAMSVDEFRRIAARVEGEVAKIIVGQAEIL